MGEMVTFRSNGGEADGYLAVPESGSGPGVVVIQEWWGLNDQIKEVCDRYAAEGFVETARRKKKKRHDLKGKVVVNLFFEPNGKQRRGYTLRQCRGSSACCIRTRRVTRFLRSNHLDRTRASLTTSLPPPLSCRRGKWPAIGRSSFARPSHSCSCRTHLFRPRWFPLSPCRK